ncbi:MAG: hypothetical protein K0R40_1037 [Burkholderiales bacterium]|jgi:hypothetical protein|nr:hypothetical protein [Burkholderiales bacterium]
MRLTISTALVLALFANLLPGCERTATDREEAASKGGASGQSPGGAATGQAGEGSTQDKRTKY